MPPTDPRFLDSTLEDMTVDLWAWAHYEDPKLRDEVISTGFDEDLAAMEAEALAREAQEALPKPPVKVVGTDDWETVVDERY
jgi:hypothetical protein